ncbi:MAG: ribose-5-phosphate isomerase RpiA [Candidatus Bathyarchaeota archaeon]
MSWQEKAKLRAAVEAVKHVKSGHIVGLGSGTTAAYAVRQLGKKVREEGIDVLGVPTSYQASFLAAEEKIPLTTLNEHPQLDLAIDGADQINKNLALIKGGGAALTREKIVGSTAKRFIIIADETKLVSKIGLGYPLPVEVIPFSALSVIKKLKEFCKSVKVREGTGKVGPITTDNGGFILDASFRGIAKPGELEMRIKKIPGVVECGLFVNLVHMAYLGKKNGEVLKLTKPRRTIS